MKKLITLLTVIAVLAAGIFILMKSGEYLKNKVLSSIDRPKVQTIPAEEAHLEKKREAQYRPGDEVALFFKDGNAIVGELVEITDSEYIINWKGQDTAVSSGQIVKIGSPREALTKGQAISDEDISKWWPYDNDIVIRLTNRAVLDAKIKKVDGDLLTLLYTVEGGSIEQELDRSKVEHLIFKPIENEESRKVQSMLERLFPKMKFYRFGNFTIVSDADTMWINECSQVLRNAYTNIYLRFYSLFSERKPKIQNFVVIFDSYGDFVDYAITDGVPGWMVAGYFSPEDKVLYLFNVLGKEFSAILFDAMVGESGRGIDEIVNDVKKYIDDRYSIFLEGEAKAVKDKFWKAYSYYKDLFREMTYSTLRHEFTHQVFYNWGLQNIILSRVKQDADKLIEKKKEYLETKDCKKKAELVKALISMRGGEKMLDMRAANSWLVEGVATYCETNPLGKKNDQWLFLYQEMIRKNAMNPLEALTVYKMGSFPGIYPESMLYMYAQSWAFASFLMDRYPDEFMEYQNRMVQKSAEGYEDITWLLECVGKDLRTVESEFKEYMGGYDQLEDPFIVHFGRLYSIFQE